MRGQIIKKMEITENSIQVELGSHQNGRYLIKIVFRDKSYVGRDPKSD
jgi:hypothetical protein